MSDDIIVSVTMREFESEKSVDKKLNMIFKVLSAQQIRCGLEVTEFDKRIVNLETNQKLRKAKMIGIGIGSGTGGAGLYTLIKSWLTGG